MKQYNFKNKWVTIVDCYCVRGHGAWVTDAVYTATGDTLSEIELEQFTEMHQETLYYLFTGVQTDLHISR